MKFKDLFEPIQKGNFGLTDEAIYKSIQYEGILFQSGEVIKNTILLTEWYQLMVEQKKTNQLRFLKEEE